MSWSDLYDNSEYGVKYPESKFNGTTRKYATWFLGQNYKNATSYYGAYPPMYWKRIQTFLKPNDKVVHLFSGSLTAGNYTRVDMDSTMNPDVCCKTEEVDKNIENNTIDVVFADPPYSSADSQIGYKGNYPNKKKTIHSVHKILKTGGLLFWLDTCLPMFSKKEFKLVGVITILISTNHRVRLVSVFEKVIDSGSASDTA
jgi:hypothetical protein